jgi:hypothetical protein
MPEVVASFVAIKLQGRASFFAIKLGGREEGTA